MKLSEFTRCVLCKRGVAHAGHLHFYRLSVQMMVLKPDAIRRQAGLEMMVGNAAIAQAFSPDENLAEGLPAHQGLLCANCALESDLPVAVIFESMQRDDEEREAAHEKKEKA